MLVELAVQRAQYLFDSVQFLSCGNLENGSLGRNVFFFYEVGFIAGIKKMQKVTKVRRGKNFKLLCTRYIPRTILVQELRVRAEIDSGYVHY